MTFVAGHAGRRDPAIRFIAKSKRFDFHIGISGEVIVIVDD